MFVAAGRRPQDELNNATVPDVTAGAGAGDAGQTSASDNSNRRSSTDRVTYLHERQELWSASNNDGKTIPGSSAKNAGMPARVRVLSPSSANGIPPNSTAAIFLRAEIRETCSMLLNRRLSIVETIRHGSGG